MKVVCLVSSTAGNSVGTMVSMDESLAALTVAMKGERRAASKVVVMVEMMDD